MGSFRSPASPVGVFDSGIGGLTVVAVLRELLPSEDIVYLGDTARVPYGTRSPATVIRYARGCARVLTERGVKLLVVACNTASAVALDMLRAELDVPVIGVVEPGAQAAIRAAAEREASLGQARAKTPAKIGVLATSGTIASKAYERAVALHSGRYEVVGQSAPLLVPLAEEGWLEGDVPELAARRYLEPLIACGCRVILLGCTHYPLLRPVLQRVADELAGETVSLIDSGAATAAGVTQILTERALARSTQEETQQGAQQAAHRGALSLLVSDLPQGFQRAAANFLGAELPQVEQVDVVMG